MTSPCDVSTRNGLNPPRVRAPKLVTGVEFAFFRRAAMRRWTVRYGHVFEINVPLFGRCVVVSDPALVRQVRTAGVDQLDNVAPNLGNWFGAGSTFALDGSRHHDRRRLLAPALHGQSLKGCAQVIEEETLRESANWPAGKEFRSFEPMNRITLAVILRLVLGADGAELDELSEIVPPYMTLGQVLAFVPAPTGWARRHGPWRKLDGFRGVFDRIVFTLIDKAQADPRLDDRTDVLALRRASILELLRSRTVIDVFGRRVNAPAFDLGQWRIPQGRTVLVRIADLHGHPQIYPHPERFDPHRFLGVRPSASAWLPFGGGTRRCLGADFAIAEVDIVLRTVLRNFCITTDDAPDEKSRFRGIAHVPRRGGRVVVHRRK